MTTAAHITWSWSLVSQRCQPCWRLNSLSGIVLQLENSFSWLVEKQPEPHLHRAWLPRVCRQKPHSKDALILDKKQFGTGGGVACFYLVHIKMNRKLLLNRSDEIWGAVPKPKKNPIPIYHYEIRSLAPPKSQSLKKNYLETLRDGGIQEIRRWVPEHILAANLVLGVITIIFFFLIRQIHLFYLLQRLQKLLCNTRLNYYNLLQIRAVKRSVKTDFTQLLAQCQPIPLLQCHHLIQFFLRFPPPTNSLHHHQQQQQPQSNPLIPKQT